MMKKVYNIVLVITLMMMIIAFLYTGIMLNEKGIYNSVNKIILPHYNDERVIKYEYMIEDIDDDWIECINYEINADNLPSGKHKVIIRIQNEDGTYDACMESNIIVERPFWRSKYAYILYISIVIGLIIYNKKKVNYLDKIIKNKTKALESETEKNSKLLNKLLESEKMRNCYFVNMSHELRTPINVISSTCQLVSELNHNENGIEKEKLDHYMKVCRKNSNNLLEIINDIIDMAKMKNNSFPLNIENHDIVSIVEDSALTLKDYVEKKGIEMIIDPDIEEKLVECDKRQIERCIVNLVGNAFKFTSPGGYIKVFVNDLDDKVQIKVSDNGKGIAKENHESIFNRFTQVCYNNNTHKGSGLGLTITKQIIDNHNGTISVESEIGKGSSFIITLPVKHNTFDKKDDIAV